MLSEDTRLREKNVPSSRDRKGRAQGLRQRVRLDVKGYEFPGLGARSAVFLVHAKRLRQAPGEAVQGGFAGRRALRTGCYHSHSVNVL